MLKIAIVVLLASCLPHVDPMPRSQPQQSSTVVSLEISCSDPDLDDAPWSVDRSATGVVISERHILTAAHAVSCPTIPSVRATLANGRRLSVSVERDDAMFGAGTDVARLVISSDDRFGLGVAPPVLASDDAHVTQTEWCAALLGGRRSCGLVLGRASLGMEHTFFSAQTQPGDSGAPVYSDGKLVGLVVRGGSGVTQVVRIGAEWLQGT